MKKQFALVFVLFTIAFGSLNVVYKILPTVRATYVEGVITQDTMWTLVDSPFVLSNNVTVTSGATLTIEPGVQIRFGGDFSLIVNGRIVAVGTEERNIVFTTNDPSHNITWRTIEINGIQSSPFSNCIVEYGKNGITLTNGLLDVENSTIRFNSENGMMLNGGTLTLHDSELANNTFSAVNVAGGNSVSIENNVIDSNGNGVTIEGGTLVNVNNNVITSNVKGIELDGNLTGTINIRQNNIAGNSFGLFVSAVSSTYITRNYISNNTVGIQYDGPASHQVYFNDIFENEQAIALSLSYGGIVNAAHNYWGEETGPRHYSLNPYGKGNIVGGDGTNLVFIPWLTRPFAYSNIPPTAVLWTDKVLVAPGQTVTFVGTDSQDEGSVYRYFFDFDDYQSSGWTTLSLFNHSYSGTGTYVASLFVEDDFGSASAAAFATVNVANLIPLDVSVTLSNSTVIDNGETSVTAYVSTAAGPLASATVTLLSVRGGTFSPQSGVTDANGYFTANFTAPYVNDTTDVRVIARASFNGYADGSDYDYVRVLAPLRVQVTASPDTMLSEQTSIIAANVTFESNPVVNATVTVTSNAGGSFSVTTQPTDQTGMAFFIFIAPQTSESAGINATITATAFKSEYGEAENYTRVMIMPKVLSINVLSDQPVTYSDGGSNITVNAAFENIPVQGVNVAITASNGALSQMTGVTDDSGNAIFIYTAPSVDTATNVTFSVGASKPGYFANPSELNITVNPRTFSFQVTPAYVHSGQKETVLINLTSSEDGIQVVGATVTISYGNAAPLTRITDSTGTCTFTINVPQAPPDTLNMTITMSKSGYTQRQSTVIFNVIPAEQGFPWLTVLLILIPVVAAVVVLILIKMKLIVISTKEEAEGK